MNNRRFRENTFLVDFGNIPKKPSSEEVHTFVGRHLGVTREQLVQIQLHHIDDCVYVKLTNLLLAQKIVSDHDNKHDFVVKGVKYKLRLRMADGGIEVKLHDLSENVTSEQISRHMTAYGEVLSIDWLVFGDKHHIPGLRSGVRQVKMVLRELIKSYVTIAANQHRERNAGVRELRRTTLRQGSRIDAAKPVGIKTPKANNRSGQLTATKHDERRLALSHQIGGYDCSREEDHRPDNY
ncbi:hypothetical protein quinque_000715 [Culex quinquefasciatus]